MEPDTTAPSTPIVIAVPQVDVSQIDLTWRASTDTVWLPIGWKSTGIKDEQGWITYRPFDGGNGWTLGLSVIIMGIIVGLLLPRICQWIRR